MPPASLIATSFRSGSTCREAPEENGLVISQRITTGNSSPLALWTVIRRTPSTPSSIMFCSLRSDTSERVSR